MKKPPSQVTVYRYPFWQVAISTFISIGFFATGLFFGVDMLAQVAFGQSLFGGEGTLPSLGAFAGCIFCVLISGFPLNYSPAIGINGHLMVRIFGIRWVAIPWEDVEAIVLQRSIPQTGAYLWKVLVRRGLTPWHYFNGLMGVDPHWLPAFFITSSIGETLSTFDFDGARDTYADIVARFAQHLPEEFDPGEP